MGAFRLSAARVATVASDARGLAAMEEAVVASVVLAAGGRETTDRQTNSILRAITLREGLTDAPGQRDNLTERVLPMAVDAGRRLGL